MHEHFVILMCVKSQEEANVQDDLISLETWKISRRTFLWDQLMGAGLI